MAGLCKDFYLELGFFRIRINTNKHGYFFVFSAFTALSAILFFLTGCSGGEMILPTAVPLAVAPEIATAQAEAGEDSVVVVVAEHVEPVQTDFVQYCLITSLECFRL